MTPNDSTTLTARANSSATRRKARSATSSERSSSTAISSTVAVRIKKSRKKKTTLVARPSDTQNTSRLSDRQLDVLASLADFDAFDGWARPMDIGGRNGSYHSLTLAQLAKRGLAERKKLHAIYCYHGTTQRQKLVDGRWVTTEGHPPSEKCCCKGSCRYQITPAGQEALK